ncbi:MAG: sigma-54 dependent transcriptional regulator, partial [Acidobacteriia bacterium]|nr:sigma-54 dependent transcriptional regulator [Terriglobia bacterium]
QLEILTADNPEAGHELFFQHHPLIVLVDLMMPKISGMQLLETFVAADPAVEVILITAHYSTESAVEAIQKGAYDYLTKPFDLEKLRARIGSILGDAQRRERTAQLDRELLDVYEFEGMIGRSPLMLDVFARIRRASPHFKTILVTGSTGTGKELVARALHRLSPVSARPFAVVNCSALVDTLLESELFGYVKGAFTGADRDKVGVFEYADGGTVFLDEIGELPLPAQAKLLRVLQNQEVQRVGSPIPRMVNVRVIAATNRDLKNRIAEGAFREDLYYRLAMIEVSLPPLADRKEDLPLLQRSLVTKFAAQYHKEVHGITRRAQARLARHSWPGNVRELENVIGNACMMVQGNVIDIDDLPESLRRRTDVPMEGEEGILTLEQVQRRHVLDVLQRVKGNKLRAAEALGIGRGTLYEMLARMKAPAVINSDRGPKASGELSLPRQDGTG